MATQSASSTLAALFQDGIAHFLRFQGRPERRLGRSAGRKPRQKVGHLVDKGVLIADLQSRHPPLFHVGMLAAVVGDMDRARS